MNDTRERAVRVPVTMPCDMARAAKILAALEGTSRSALIREGLEMVLAIRACEGQDRGQDRHGDGR